MNGQQFIRVVERRQHHHHGHRQAARERRLRAAGRLHHHGRSDLASPARASSASGTDRGERRQCRLHHLTADGNVTLENNSHVIGHRRELDSDLGMLFTDGGELDIVSNAGSITLMARSRSGAPIRAPAASSTCRRRSTSPSTIPSTSAAAVAAAASSRPRRATRSRSRATSSATAPSAAALAARSI